MSAGGNRIFVAMDDQSCADFLAEPIAKFNHFFELVTRVDVKEGKRQRSGIKSLPRQVHKDARILADGIQQDRIPELRDSLAQNINRFALKLAKVCPILIHDLRFYLNAG